jgi:hypothetical protein
MIAVEGWTPHFKEETLVFLISKTHIQRCTDILTLP